MTCSEVGRSLDHDSETPSPAYIKAVIIIVNIGWFFTVTGLALLLWTLAIDYDYN